MTVLLSLWTVERWVKINPQRINARSVWRPVLILVVRLLKCNGNKTRDDVLS